jgi:hypothetical protein
MVPFISALSEASEFCSWTVAVLTWAWAWWLP